MSDEEEILDFWFGELDEHGCASPTQRKHWWTKSDAFDATIRARFLSDYESIVSGERERWRSTPRGALAYIIVLDQFSRNMFRDTPEMFASDPLAREVCYEGLDAGFDAELGFDERAFFYLPLEHSEDIHDQERCHEVFTNLCEVAPESLKADARYYLDYAERHREIIERFGRYPHRNEILGRVSTDEEIEFLKQPGSSF
ncbi:MAG: DUF924 domain-containing protein [Deltaproteobacteria bacterium]|jgi:uncharacterized protein (DUF924 family)|nr:DUF924 domain-containing protein [Deltaproteobacteria bacterium]